MRIYQGLKWPQPLIRVSLHPDCSHHKSMHNAVGAVHTATPCSHIPEKGSYCTAGHVPQGVIGSMQSLIHPLACPCLTLGEYLSPENNPRLLQWGFQLVAVGILDIRCSALTAIINFSKCSFTSFFVNRW